MRVESRRERPIDRMTSVIVQSATEYAREDKRVDSRGSGESERKMIWLSWEGALARSGHFLSWYSMLVPYDVCSIRIAIQRRTSLFLWPVRIMNCDPNRFSLARLEETPNSNRFNKLFFTDCFRHLPSSGLLLQRFRNSTVIFVVRAPRLFSFFSKFMLYSKRIVLKLSTRFLTSCRSCL